ncbi:hypothetical protein [Kribbella speibonae]|uniref:Minor tail protein n=1 Tax=Kribbella speibonae TaxID=1572660 RepID=A0ABY2AB26_9ACTN|nr:hypothetical protein [Kribbella speibonae]TCC26721.1 hypothetical protein E0H58_01445 [Kribbella speibonae]
MSLTATYDGVLSRIELAGTSLGAIATYAVFDRTEDGITYTTVRGGSAVTVTSQNAALNDYEWEAGTATTYRVRSYSAADVLQEYFTTSITQDLTTPWLKVPAAPFLNQPVDVMDIGDVTRKSRAGVFSIVGRSFPVAVGDVASSLAYTLQLLTRTRAEWIDLDFLFASGEIVYLQMPSEAAFEHLESSGYFVVGDVSRTPVSKVSDLRVWTVPLTEVAAPGPEVVGSAYTWASTISEYATWADVIADNLTWADLLARTGTPSDVIVP